MDEIRFSVILPAYNVEAFIGQALECLLKQTYPAYEVIVVEDGSTDHTAPKAQAYAAAFTGQDISFQVICHSINRGVSAARNTGMDRAGGEYVLFLDPDDFYEITMLERIAAGIRQYEHPQILLFGYREDYYGTDGRLSSSVVKSRPTFSWKKSAGSAGDYAAELAEQEAATMLGYPWNKAYRLDFLRQEKITFPQVTHIEDILFNLQAVGCAGSFAVISEILYHYRNQGQVRLTGKYLPNYMNLQKQRIRAFLEMESNLLDCRVEKLPRRTLEVAANFYFRSFQSMAARQIAHGMTKEDVLAELETEGASPLYHLLQPYLAPGGKMAQILYQPLAKQQWHRVYGCSRMVGAVQKYLPGLFARAKQSR
jgi:glycosyltransferase involved in cell wall biosynthesis